MSANLENILIKVQLNHIQENIYKIISVLNIVY